MDSILLALCFVAMSVFVLAWAMLPHRVESAPRPVQYRPREAATDPALTIQVA